MNHNLSTFIESYANKHFPLIHSPPNLLMISYPPVLFGFQFYPFLLINSFSIHLSPSHTLNLLIYSSFKHFSQICYFQNLCILILPFFLINFFIIGTIFNHWKIFFSFGYNKWKLCFSHFLFFVWFFHNNEIVSFLSFCLLDSCCPAQVQ